MIFFPSCALSEPCNDVLALCLEAPPCCSELGEVHTKALLFLESGETASKTISVQLVCLVGSSLIAEKVTKRPAGVSQWLCIDL